MDFFRRLLSLSRRPMGREVAVLAAFCALATVMTWPLAYYLRDGVTDTGDPYLNAWIMWWDYHQTFHDPIHLFQAPIFYPYQFTLAFSEHFYGIALLFFPLYALGFQPLTVQAVATLLAFAFSGYGAFRLTRTVSGSTRAAWVAGIGFAFVPYRFQQMPHLVYIFAGWLPLTLEALVLYARERTRKRAFWLGLAFLMNALTSIHWFVLALLPLGLAAVLLVQQFSLWRDKKFWWRGGLAIGVALLALLPFLWPYQKVKEIYGLARDRNEAASFSAVPADWLKADERNKLWAGFGQTGEPPGERSLFPGVLLPLLALAAFLPMPSGAGGRKSVVRSQWSEVSGQKSVVSETQVGRETEISGPQKSRHAATDVTRQNSAQKDSIRHSPHNLLTDHLPPTDHRPLPTDYLPPTDHRPLTTDHYFLARGLGVIWLAMGFAGSLGMNFIFHRLLFEYGVVFRSIRVPARWAMIACVGLALLAGLGAARLGAWFSRWFMPQTSAWAVGLAICGLLLFELRAAPLIIERGEVDPDAVTLFLKETPMRGGVAHLPATQGRSNYRYTLRQADHQKPLITAYSGFVPPLEAEIEALSTQQPVPEKLLDTLENVPTSYLVVHWYALPQPQQAALASLLGPAVTAGRLRLVRTFPVSQSREDIYVFTRNEPDAP